MKKVKDGQIGSYILKPSEIQIQYSTSIINMSNSKMENDVYTLLLIGYIKKHINFIGEVSTTLNQMSLECGYYTKGNSKENNKHFKIAIKKLIDNNYIRLDDGNKIDDIKNTEFFRIHLVGDNDLFYHTGKFITITVADFDLITSCYNKSVKVGIILNTYLAIKQFVYDDSQIVYPAKSNLMKMIGVSSYTTLNNAINILKELGLIFTSSDYYIKNTDGSDTYVQTRRMYALNKKALCNSKTALSDLYKGVTVYSISEIDNSKIVRLNTKNSLD